MSAAPTVSIIIPTHNYGEFIGDALRSVEQQSLKDWECLIIDDASTDDTAGVVRDFVERDDRFKYIRLDRNVGVSAARNQGFEHVQGRYIQMVDADDVIAPRKLETQVAFLEETLDVDVLYSDYIAFAGEPITSGVGAYRADERLTGTGDSIIRRLLRGNVFRLNTVLFRASVLSSVHGFRSDLRYAEDWDFWLRIASAGHAFHFLADPEAMSGVRRNPRSLSTDRPAMGRHYLPVLQNLWQHSDLSLRNRIGILIRYALQLLNMLILRTGEVLVLPDGRWPFLFYAGVVALILLPFWPLYELMRYVNQFKAKAPKANGA